MIAECMRYWVVSMRETEGPWRERRREKRVVERVIFEGSVFEEDGSCGGRGLPCWIDLIVGGSCK